MSNTLSYATPAVASKEDLIEKTRRTILAIGVLSIALGAVGLTNHRSMDTELMWMYRSGNATPSDLGWMLLNTMWSVVASTMMVVVGLGACRASQWTRPLALLAGWMLLAGALVSLCSSVLVIFGDSGLSISRAGPGRSGELLRAFLPLMINAAVSLAVPLVYIMYFRRPVARTALQEVSPGWLSRRSSMSVALAGGLASVAALSLSMFSFPSVPVFGTYVPTILAIPMAVFAALVVAAVLVLCDWVGGWIVALLVVLTLWLSLLITLMSDDIPTSRNASGFGITSGSSPNMMLLEVAVVGAAAVSFILIGLIRKLRRSE